MTIHIHTVIIHTVRYILQYLCFSTCCVESARAIATRNLSCENLLCWRYTIEDGYSSVHGGMLARTKQQGGPPATQYSTTTVEESR